MLIEHNELLIRNANPSDAQILCKWWNDGEVMSHAGFPKGLGTTCEKVEKDLETNSDETHRMLIIEYIDEPIGEIGYRNKGAKTAEIGIKICDFTKQEKGLGSIILRLLIKSLFEDYNFEKIILDTDLDNIRAQHVYEKIGFRKVKINYNSWKNQLGELQSSVDYELKKEDFKLSGESM